MPILKTKGGGVMMYNEKNKTKKNSNRHFFPGPYFLCVIINELEVGSTTNSPYLGQTLVVTALSSHRVEESPTNSTPSHLSQWLRAGKRAQAGRLRKHQKKSIPDNCSSVFLARYEKHLNAGN